MYNALQSTIGVLTSDFESIAPERKRVLDEVADYITNELHATGDAKINFICTHNSRRSQMAQIWAQTAADYYNVEGLKAFSGGVTSTEFDKRAVNAIDRAGFRYRDPSGENPTYSIRFDKDKDHVICYSKTFNDPDNPSEDFAAIMTCSEADVKCPIIPGASYRQLITYDDPKEADGSDKEAEVYDLCCQKIGKEMLYLMNRVESLL
jgi:arsenate reductase